MYTTATAVLIDSMCVMERENLCIARRTGFVNSMSIVEKMKLVGFLDSTYIIAARIVYLYCAISISRSPITRLES